MSREPLIAEPLSRRQLIALNADLRISRGAVCRLALCNEPWWARSGTTAKTTASDLGVAPGDLKHARAALDGVSDLAGGQKERARSSGVDIITIRDSTYPAALHDLALPPPVIYVRGSLPDRPCLSIVGARKASAYGLDVARAFAGRLAERGLAIVSGFAPGVDIAAHRAALEAPGGTTLAILGCGLDVDYPRGRRADRLAIPQRGALVSEFPFGATPLARNFPIRNRLIAALGHGTLVVEATARSGSLITARLALELGREIYAIPGRIFDGLAAGPNTLTRDGAFVVQHPSDILETLPQALSQQLAIPPEQAAAGQSPGAPLAAAQRSVLELLPPGQRITLDTLAGESELGVDRIAGILLHLELAGWVRRHPGPSYARSDLW